MSAPRHPQETARLARLNSYRVLDTPREHRFDRVVFLAAQIVKVPIAYVAFIDSERQWFKSQVGFTNRQSPREIAFCEFTILEPSLLIVEDTREDPRFARNPFVTDAPFVRFYAGVPLRSEEGLPVGTLCVVDRQPRRLTPEQARNLIALGKEVEEQLYIHDELAAAAD